MKLLSTLLASTVLAASAGAAMADTIGSYGTNPGTTGYTAPSSFSNSALTYSGSTISSTQGATYDLPTGNAWAAPTGGASWVGINPQDFPGGSNVEPSGVYFFNTTFNATAGDVLDLSLMADDTTSVYLNGTLVLSPSSFTAAAHCVTGLPTCTMNDNVQISGLTTGSNELSFGVQQIYKNATGVEFSGTVAATPEPSSLLLLGSGLTTVAGMAFRRRKLA